jgi:hypothetical protein
MTLQMDGNELAMVIRAMRLYGESDECVECEDRDQAFALWKTLDLHWDAEYGGTEGIEPHVPEEEQKGQTKHV